MIAERDLLMAHMRQLANVVGLLRAMTISVTGRCSAFDVTL
jgi:hypothetical protein